MNEHANVVLVDDDSNALFSLQRTIKAFALQAAVHCASTAEKALSLIRDKSADVAIVDLSLNVKDGIESGFALLRAILANETTCRVIVLTGHSGIECGVRAINEGAANFVEKPADIPYLCALIQDGIRQSRLRKAYRDLRISSNVPFPQIVGESAAVKRLKEELSFVAHNNIAVLLLGESGTGKGLCAEIVHRNSRRRNANFVRYQPNFCGADLSHSDLFGHTKGAFTGALQERKGAISEAASGTLFLDEIGELPQVTQIALLGVLQDKKFKPLGASREMISDFRLISATNCSADELLQGGKMRKDFFHRIAHYMITVPPLRERKSDLEALATEMVKRISSNEQLGLLGLESDAVKKLAAYDWPGNVRELNAVIENAAYRAHQANKNYIAGEEIFLPTSAFIAGECLNIHQQVKQYRLKIIKEKLAETNGNQMQAARELGIDRGSLRRHLLTDS